MSTFGDVVVLRHYRTPEGTRALVAQRIDGHVALSDVPDGDEGRVYLVERHLESTAEMDAIVADYAARSEQLGHPAMIVDLDHAPDDLAIAA